jgi:hypothetical protein
MLFDHVAVFRITRAALSSTYSSHWPEALSSGLDRGVCVAPPSLCHVEPYGKLETLSCRQLPRNVPDTACER